MVNTLEPEKIEFQLPEALLPDGTRLENVTIRITGPLPGASTDGARLFEAVLHHADHSGMNNSSLLEVICKLVPINPVSKHVPERLGDREKIAYQEIRRIDEESRLNGSGIPMPLAHLIGHREINDEHAFIIERYGDNALTRIGKLKGADRAAEVQHFFASGYLALRHLNQRVKISMRDAHPRNFVFREPRPGELGFQYVAVDFGHANVGPVNTLEHPLEAMAVVQHPDVLADRKHRGLVDDIFSLAVSAYILLSGDLSTPWVGLDGERIHHRPGETDQITFGMPNSRHHLKPHWEVLAGSGNTPADFLSLLQEILSPEREWADRQRYILDELPALIVQLEPWTAEAVAEMESEAPANATNMTVPLPPPAATTPMPGLTRAGFEPRRPHAIPYLAQLEDFRPPPPPLPVPTPSIHQQRRESIARRLRSGTPKVVPFVAIAATLAIVKFLMSRLHDINALPAGWQLPENILLVLAFAAAVGGYLTFRDTVPTTVLKGTAQGAGAGAIAGLVGLLIPTGVVVGVQQVLYLMPGITWRYDEWSFWPQWFLVILVLSVPVILFVALLANDRRRSFVRLSVAVAMVAVGSTLIAAGAPQSFLDQHAVEVNCGSSTYEFTQATQSLCIPVSAEWKKLDSYPSDPFVTAMKLPAASAAGAGPGGSAVGLVSMQFPCVSLFVNWKRPDGANGEIKVPTQTTNPNSQLTSLSPEAPDGRIDHLRLGGGSYIEYRGNSSSADSISGTTAYAAISSMVPFASPEQVLANDIQGTTVYQVERGCAASDQNGIDASARKLISSMRLNERFRLDVSELQYNPDALAKSGLTASKIAVPVPRGFAVPVLNGQTLTANGKGLAEGAVFLTNNDVTKRAYATVLFSLEKPDGYDSATQSSVDPKWVSTAVDSTNGKSQQKFFQKETVGSTDVYVTVWLTVQDPGSYDDPAKNRFTNVLSGVHVSDNSIDVWKGITS